MIGAANFSPRMLGALLRADLVNIARDPLLIGGAAMAIVPGILLFVFAQQIETAGRDTFGMSGLAVALAGLALMIGPGIMGWIFGFLLIEDRDDNVLVALEITPLGKAGFVAYRLVAAFVLALGIAALVSALALPETAIGQRIGIIVVASLHAPATMLFLVGFAANKVEALALTKLVNFALVAPLLALAPAPWRYVAGLVPPFWVGEMLAMRADAAPLPLAFALGAIASCVVIGLLYRRMRNRLG